MRTLRIARSCLHFIKSRFRDNSAILLYHRIAEDARDPFRLCVSPTNFEKQMGVIPQLGKPLSIADFTRRQQEGTLEKGSLCLTFDDGYLDFLENALPILEKHEVPAAVYCVTANVGAMFWWDRLNDLIEGAASLPSPLFLEDGPSVPTWGLGREEVFGKVYALLRNRHPDERNRALDRLEETIPPQSSLGNRPRQMTAQEIKDLSAHPLITIGAHTVSHSCLAKLSFDEQFNEIATSKAELSRITGRPIETFSYPFGLGTRDYDETTCGAVRRAGFSHALAADKGVVNHRSDHFALPRLWVHDTGAESFQRKVGWWL